ncbi:uncharacterized protein LOC133796116 [Humulus lupulus]|uniref:uncharacterized protein LOC133796116 n=1 Tax=Humulus lupulus TaxID=3486 RepID=UPI002B40C98E|nr:uncharacterized protein LOC133796116 [Humulus lupulus]
MINTLHDAEVHGATIDDRTQVSLILESLTPTFSTFTTNYVMNKLEYNMTQLLNVLKTFKSLNKSNSKEKKKIFLILNLPLQKGKNKKIKKSNDKDNEKHEKKPKKSSKSKENK